MNIFAQLIGAAFNILQIPFANETYGVVTTSPVPGVDHGDNIIPYYASNNHEDQTNQPSLFPLNLIRGVGINSCNTVWLRFGENEVKLSLLPRGYCPNCCPVKIARDIRFTLFNKQNTNNGKLIYPFNEKGAALKAGANPNGPTVIFIHGFTETSPGESGAVIIDAYLSRPENYNIILLDWSELSTFPWYKQAVLNGKLVGKVLAEFLATFQDSGEIPLKSVHIIGFSLGSHIASHAGKQMRKDLKIPRITALDPAFPEFSIKDTSRRLTASDAEYVDVIHTDSGILGFPISLGNADFYPNGGRALQPGCQPSYLANQRLLDQVFACSHVRAWRLYAESVRNKDAFPATKCPLWRGPNRQCNFTMDAFMGFANHNTSGQYYLLTKFKYPFARSIKEQV